MDLTGIIIASLLIGAGVFFGLKLSLKKPRDTSEEKIVDGAIQDASTLPQFSFGSADSDQENDQVQENAGRQSSEPKDPKKKNAGFSNKASSNKNVGRFYRPPQTPSNFMGREDDIEEILRSGIQAGVILSGEKKLQGIGKTVLAIRLAEILSPQFSDARIFIKMKGQLPFPLTPAQGMAQVIRAFLPTVSLPEDEKGLKKIYSKVLHNKKAILIFDDVKNEAQIKNLIPQRGCFTIITSRGPLALKGFHHEIVKPLDLKEAEKLLDSLSPKATVLANEIVKHCGGIPMSILLSGNYLKRNMTKDMSPVLYSNKLRSRLKVENNNALSSDNLEIIAPLKIIYGGLDKKSSNILRKLSIFSGSFTDKAEEFICQDGNNAGLKNLVALSLVEYDPGGKRYSLHDVVWKFAESRLTKAELAISAKRLATYYYTELVKFHELAEKGGQSNLVKALDSFDMEWDNIQAGYSWAEYNWESDEDAKNLMNSYADAAPELYALRQSKKQRIQWLKNALKIAVLNKDPKQMGAQMEALGVALLELEDFQEAGNFLQQAVELARVANNRIKEMEILTLMATCLMKLGKFTQAIELYEKIRSFHKSNDDTKAQIKMISQIGEARIGLNDTRGAVQEFEQALALARGSMDGKSEGQQLENLGRTYQELGEFDRAIVYYEQSVSSNREVGNLLGEAHGLWQICLSLMKIGEKTKAIERGETAIKTMMKAKHPETKKALAQIKNWKAKKETIQEVAPGKGD